jgi:hypothetical protein
MSFSANEAIVCVVAYPISFVPREGAAVAVIFFVQQPDVPVCPLSPWH